ncbi:MAG: hypothetical protein DRN15_01935 [Thermoprotei archaeon]|nr:MAG: hypothetical protein DRN15_01935 [Thermoprotei archaeon]
MSFEEEIKRLLEAEDDVSKLALDTLRALAVFHGVLWLSELPTDIIKIRRGLPEYPLTPELLVSAVKLLEDLGLVTTEERTRGFMLGPGTHLDVLIRLVDHIGIKRTLYFIDSEFARYLVERDQRIREALRRRRARDRGVEDEGS